MVQRIRAVSRIDQDFKQLIEQQFSNFEKFERELRERERLERANQLGMPGLVMQQQ
jgi:hypothetical protein